MKKRISSRKKKVIFMSMLSVLGYGTIFYESGWKSAVAIFICFWASNIEDSLMKH